MLPLKLPFTVLHVTLVARETVQLPPFSGSKLEGAFGRALHALACVGPMEESGKHCSLRDICPYCLLYAPKPPPEVQASSLSTPPRPIVFRVTYGEERYLRAGDLLRFGMVVVGRGIEQLPYILAALHDMGEAGLGRMRGRLSLDEVVSVQPYTGAETVLMRGGEPSVNLAPIVLEVDDLPPIIAPRIGLDLLSPLHLRAGGEMQTDIQFPLLIRNLQRRMSNLEQVHGGGASFGADYAALPALAEAEVSTVYQYLQPAAQLRKGARKGRTTSMEGVVGRVEYTGNLAPFAPLLRLGEQLGVGKWAHFGAGLYDMHSLPSNGQGGQT